MPGQHSLLQHQRIQRNALVLVAQLDIHTSISS